MPKKLFSRFYLVALVGFVLCLSPALAPALADEEPRVTGWNDLLVNGEIGDIDKGVKRDNSQLHGISFIPEFFPTNPDLDGKLIKMPGYVVPMEYMIGQLKEFMLAPFVGACIHVPPPPPNQLVYVITDEPLEMKDLYKPVWVIGRMKTVLKKAEIASAGYVLTAISVEPYEVDENADENNVVSVH